MKQILIFNIGNRDLYFKEPIEVSGVTLTDYIFLRGSSGPSFRDISQFLFDNYDSIKEKVYFPIIEKTLDRLIRRNKLKQIDEIFLFVSDQKVPYHTDTIYIGKLFEVYLMDLKKHDRYKKVIGAIKKPKLRIINGNPSDMDLMMDFYNQQLQRLSSNNEGALFHISITSGTQAMNTMLLFNSLKYFGNHANILYLPKDSTMPVQLQIGQMIKRENYINSIKENIEAFDYHAAIEVLQKHHHEFLELEEANILINALKYVHSRLSFDFDSAEEYIQYVYDKLPTHRTQLDNLYSQIFELGESAEEKLDRMLSELYWNAWLLYQRGQYIDVVGRLFRFHEAILKIIITQKLKIPLIEGGKKLSLAWFDKEHGLQEFLNTYPTEDGNPVSLRNKVLNRFTMGCIIEYYQKQGKLPSSITEAVKVIDQLANLRNKLILAHGWKGCSEEDLYIYTKDLLQISERSELENKLFTMLRDVYSIVYEPSIVEQNIYEVLNEVLLSILNQVSE